MKKIVALLMILLFLSSFSLLFAGRIFDPQLARWMQVDPADEFHSPYVYCGNNPVNFIDPDGSETIDAKMTRIYDIATNENMSNFYNIVEVGSFNLERKYRQNYWTNPRKWRDKYGISFFTKDRKFLQSSTMQNFQKGNTQVIKCCVQILQLASPTPFDALESGDALTLTLQAVAEYFTDFDAFVELADKFNIQKAEDLSEYGVDFDYLETLEDPSERAKYINQTLNNYEE